MSGRLATPAGSQATASGDDILRDRLAEALIQAPGRFSFDAAVAVLDRAAAHDGAAVRFAASVGLAYPARGVEAIGPEPDGTWRLSTGLIGLTGPEGPLPRFYTEQVNAERRRRAASLADFLDMLAQGAITQFAAAAVKYRPHLAALRAGGRPQGEAPHQPMRDALLALTGQALDAAAAAGADRDAVLFYAGAFAARPRSTERLETILSDWLEQPVRVIAFAGIWRRIDRSERTSLPSAKQAGGFNRLGVDAAVGANFWDIQSRIVLRLGPLDRATFEALLPGRPNLAALLRLARLYLDGAAEVSVNPVLARDAVPPLALSATTGGRLGWNSWLTMTAPRQHDADEALFAPANTGRAAC